MKNIGLAHKMAWHAYQNLFERRNLMGFIDVENVRYQFSLQFDAILLRLIKLCVNWFQSRKYHDTLWYAINRNDDSRLKKMSAPRKKTRPKNSLKLTQLDDCDSKTPIQTNPKISLLSFPETNIELIFRKRVTLCHQPMASTQMHE